MIFIRSVIFNILFILNNMLWFIFAVPTLLIPQKRFMSAVLHRWCRSNLWIHRVICNVTTEFRGRENIPSGGFMVASKHQSAWETFGLTAEFPDPRYIIKRELMWIPMFGLYLSHSGQVPINRGDRIKAIHAMNEAARVAVVDGAQLIIFPEGTRRPYDAEPHYKMGVAHLYETMGVPVLPVALNAGVVWPRQKFMKYPGKIIVEFLPVIPAGLSKEEFFQRMKEAIETSTQRIVKEALSERV
jgi:1-acyl-sn-glycerol-3-phosphate acyltransferase